MEGVQYKKTVGEYGIVERIGVGSFAQVYKGVHQPTGRVVAVKALDRGKMSRKLLDNLDSEITIMKSLDHDNIVRLEDVLRSPRHVYLILEYCNGGDLSTLLKSRARVNEKESQSFVRQLAQGLKYCRARNLIHRDLKPQNLLLCKSESGDLTLKIADFGFARYIGPQGMAETLCGSPLYMAPEILKFQKYDAKADLWSVGAILYELVCGQPPFRGENHVQLLKDIEKSALRWPSNLSLSTSIADLISQLLRKNPVERISFEEFFMHPFLSVPATSPIAIRGARDNVPADNTRERATSSPLVDRSPTESRALVSNSFGSGVDAANFGALVASPITPGSLPSGIGSFGTSPPFRGPSSIGSRPRTNPFKGTAPAAVVIHAQPTAMTKVQNGFAIPDSTSSNTTLLSAGSLSSRRGVSSILQASSIEQLSLEQVPAAIKRLGQRAAAIAALGKRERKYGNPTVAVMLFVKALEFLEECMEHCQKLPASPIIDAAARELSDLFDQYLSLADEAKSVSTNELDENISAEGVLYQKAMELGSAAAADELLGRTSAGNRQYIWALLILEALASDESLPEGDRATLNQYIAYFLKRIGSSRSRSSSSTNTSVASLEYSDSGNALVSGKV